MVKGSVNTIESCGMVDGPGIRYVVFLNGCKLRCRYCHNPEMWNVKDENMTPDELVDKIRKCKPYLKNNGGVTFSGGEPLLQVDFLIEVCKLLKGEKISVALDTAGVGIGKYEELLQYVDLIILDIKHTEKDKYKYLTGQCIDESLKFINIANSMNKKFWIRQVIIPGFTDTNEYLESLIKQIKGINNVEKVEFLSYHKLGTEKYEQLKIENPYKNQIEMDKNRCNELYDDFIKRLYAYK